MRSDPSHTEKKHCNQHTNPVSRQETPLVSDIGYRKLREVGGGYLDAGAMEANLREDESTFLLVQKHKRSPRQGFGNRPDTFVLVFPAR